MSLSDKQLDVIADVIRSAPTLLQATARWRERYPGVRTLRISADELVSALQPALAA